MHPPRIAFVGALYHITVRCNNREFYFQEEKDFETYLLSSFWDFSLTLSILFSKTSILRLLLFFLWRL